MPGPSCILRRTPKSLTSRRWKGDVLGTATTARAIECTGRPPGELWTAGTSCSSRHYNAYSRHRWKKLRSRLIREATAWTITTTSQKTTFCAIFAITLPCWNPLPGASADHIAVGGFSDNPPVAELLERIGEITRRDTLRGGAAGPPQEGAMPGGEPTDRFSQEVVLEPQAQAVSPTGASQEAPLAGSQPLQQRG